MKRELKTASKVRLIGSFFWLLGLGIVIGLIAHQGFEEVTAATAVAGWGLLWVVSIQLLPMFADTIAWRELLRPHVSMSLVRLFWARWIGESVNNLLPTARVGGDFLRAWLVWRKWGVSGAKAGAGVIVDLTATVATQILFTSIGLLLLFMHDADVALILGATIGAGILLAMLASFLVAQGSGLIAWLERVAKTFMLRLGWSAAFSDAHGLQAEIKKFYEQRRSIMVCGFWHLLGWIAGTLEIWAGLWLLGSPVTFLDALMLESLIQAVRGAAFFMPGALGVQEGGLILLGAVVGLTPEVALALSLIKRIRELLLGLPGLLSWQMDQLHGQFARVEDPTAR